MKFPFGGNGELFHFKCVSKCLNHIALLFGRKKGKREEHKNGRHVLKKRRRAHLSSLQRRRSVHILWILKHADNSYLLANIGFDRAENGPSKVHIRKNRSHMGNTGILLHLLFRKAITDIPVSSVKINTSTSIVKVKDKTYKESSEKSSKVYHGILAILQA